MCRGFFISKFGGNKFSIVFTSKVIIVLKYFSDELLLGVFLCISLDGGYAFNLFGEFADNGRVIDLDCFLEVLFDDANIIIRECNHLWKGWSIVCADILKDCMRDIDIIFCGDNRRTADHPSQLLVILGNDDRQDFHNPCISININDTENPPCEIVSEARLIAIYLYYF